MSAKLSSWPIIGLLYVRRFVLQCIQACDIWTCVSISKSIFGLMHKKTRLRMAYFMFLCMVDKMLTRVTNYMLTVSNKEFVFALSCVLIVIVDLSILACILLPQ